MNKHDLFKLIENLNLRRNVSFSSSDTENSKYIADFFGTVLLNGGTVLLRISFPEHFPLVFPDFFVISNDQFRLHVGSDDKICLFDASALLIKQGMEDQLVLDCFDQVVGILNISPESPQYHEEFCREFDSYWSSVSKKVVYSCITLQDIKYEQCSLLFSSSHLVLGKTRSDAETMAYDNLRIARQDTDKHANCIILRLRDKSPMLSLKTEYKWNMLRNYILNNVSSSTKREFRRFLGSVVKKHTQYIFVICPTKVGDILLGFLIQINNPGFRKIESSTEARLTPLYVTRIDYEHLTLRGGSPAELKKARILLLGCGSVGGYLANALCQLGILSLDILDKDLFMPENVYRHFLGFDALSTNGSQYKADLVRQRLEAMYPYVDIDSLNFAERTVEAFLRDTDRLANYDLIISALGEPTIDIEVNRILFQYQIKVPFITCFNEPYGIGGHVVAVNINYDSCLQCLYTGPLSSEMQTFRASLVAPEQNFKKNISGCSSAFVPYSCIDSQQTALLAARIALDILNNKIERNTLKTWIGSPDELEFHGYTTSEYYELKRGSSDVTFTEFGNVHCSVCGNNRQGVGK